MSKKDALNLILFSVAGSKEPAIVNIEQIACIEALSGEVSRITLSVGKTIDVRGDLASIMLHIDEKLRSGHA
jgi:hypothetical protein